MKMKPGAIAGTLVTAVALTACAPDETNATNETNEYAAESPREAAPGSERTTAAYDIANTAGETIGRVELVDGAGGLLLKVEIDGLEPGEHGLHLHETGRCEPPFESAGGHYAPADRSHGLLSEDGPHAGDLPNLVVGEAASTTVVHAWAEGLSVAELTGDDGSALVVHAGPDDYRTDPAGAAGERVACAAIVSS